MKEETSNLLLILVPGADMYNRSKVLHRKMVYRLVFLSPAVHRITSQALITPTKAECL